MSEILVHGSCVALGEGAVLLRGAPGAGKSDLALRFLSLFAREGAALVADDQVRLRQEKKHIIALPPERIAGLIEVRGVGIVQSAHLASARLVLIADLVSREDVARLPDSPRPREEVLGIGVPVTRIAPFEASAPVKLKLALGGAI